MQQVYNKHERKVYNVLKKFDENYKWMYKQPTQQLLNVRKVKESCVIIQPPYTDSMGETHWNDFSLFNKKYDVDLRFEVKSLDVDSDLRDIVFKHIIEAKNIPEKQLVLVLFGIGFNAQVKRYYDQYIETMELNIVIVQTIKELEKHLKGLYKD